MPDAVARMDTLGEQEGANEGLEKEVVCVMRLLQAASPLKEE